ncbi:MAG: Asp-tRNA(Asn)/Glu-tRNA(Gln) amidotransferase subunit GatA [Pseudomonadales bacterium]|nr:Asp-tRNA(Asn)/Glu-tRNA(Gln) amidotransferase subunit GatA [Pseudomonadales bacterium]
MHNKTLSEISSGLRNGDFSSEEITRHFLNRINQLDPQFNSFIAVTEEQAIQQARQADKMISAGETQALLGVPFAHKDIFCTEGVLTTSGSKMLENFISPYDSTVAANLKRAGAVNLGKTNMDEFAMGSSNETSFFGPVKNPWDVTRVPGGSSGGSAAAVAARLAPAATATDTGGSIRQPASLCGVTGLKPTYGRISRWGMIAFASSLDQAGPITQTAEDAALMLNSMAGFDPKDSTSVDQPVPDYRANLNDSLKGLTIGLPKEYFASGLDPKLENIIQEAISEYQRLGATVKEVSLPNSSLSVPVYYVIAPAECSTNLSRFDGVRYGYRCAEPINLEDMYTRTRSEGFGDEVKRRILIGTYVLSSGFYDAYYIQAQKTRRLIQQDFVNAFEQVDVLMAPTSPSPAFKFDEKTADPLTMYLEDIYTIGVNLAGLPGISIPAGQLDGLPVGLQIIGNYFSESKLLNVAHQYQQVTGWHKAQPID